MSITSKWIQSAPAATTLRTSSPSRAKSADRMLGAMRNWVMAGGAGTLRRKTDILPPGGRLAAAGRAVAARFRIKQNAEPKRRVRGPVAHAGTDSHPPVETP
ncbi:hypothetical protein EMIT0111MI5_200098 [Burkholderia sp. IT-111MI5]